MFIWNVKKWPIPVCKFIGLSCLNSIYPSFSPSAAPEIQFTEDLVYTQTGKSFYKDCVALGYPFPVVEWYQINKEVPQMKISVSHSRLVVQNIVPGLHENYTCKASVSSGDFVLWTNKTFTLISYGECNILNISVLSIPI